MLIMIAWLLSILIELDVYINIVETFQLFDLSIISSFYI